MTDPQTPDVDQPATAVDVAEVDQEPAAATAGEEDHRNPDAYRGEDADAPADTGKPPQDA